MRHADHLKVAILAATETAAAHGVVADRCEILQDGHTLVLRLGVDLVARVVSGENEVRKGDGWFSRETAVACHLSRHGAPVVPMHPALPPGPHERYGCTLNFWQFVTRIDEKPMPDQIGHALFQCHDGLRSFGQPLPELGILHETLDLLGNAVPGAMLSAADLKLLHERLSRSVGNLRGCTMQALHGDAHFGNLMNTARGLLWSDWEDTFHGPVEWDLASVIWNARCMENDQATAGAILAAYRHAGGVVEESVLRHCLIARAAVMSAWYPVLYPDASPERVDKLRFRLAWLRGDGF